MASVDHIVKERLLASPNPMRNRTDALMGVLCVTGNGYYWDENGEISTDQELVPWTPESTRTSFSNIFGYQEKPKDSDSLALWEIMEKLILETTVTTSAIVSKIDVLMYEMDEPSYVYPQYITENKGILAMAHLLFAQPENITEEWRDACVQLRAVLVHHGWVF